MRLKGLAEAIVNTASVVVLHDWAALEEKSEKQDLSVTSWHRFLCSSKRLKS